MVSYYRTRTMQSVSGVMIQHFFAHLTISLFRAERNVCTICYSSTAFKMNVYNGIAANGEEDLFFLVREGVKNTQRRGGP